MKTKPKKQYKKPSKTCARKRRNRTRVVNPINSSPKVRWEQQSPVKRERGATP